MRGRLAALAAYVGFAPLLRIRGLSPLEACGIVLGACWLLPAVAGAVLALAGSTRALPLTRRISSRPNLLWWALAATIALEAGALLVAGAAVHAMSICRREGRARAVMLYDDMGVLPRGLYCAGFYRVALAARARWGPGEVVVARYSREALEEALESARILVLATHGHAGRIWISEPEQYVAASDVRRLADAARARGATEGPDARRLVYLCACEGALDAAGWRAAFAPADVVMFDRASSGVEHALWLWTEAPGAVRSMP